MNKWFKVYSEIIDDPKIKRLTIKEKWLWVVLMCLASRNASRGQVSLVTDEIALNVTDICNACDFEKIDDEDNEEVVKSALELFQKLRMIEVDELGIITLINFEKRQDSNLSEAERASRYRHNKKVTTVTLDKIREDKIREEYKKKNRKEKDSPEGQQLLKTDFLESLKINSAYSHCDIDAELKRMDAWLALPSNRMRKKTPRFVLNWLNRIERPLPGEVKNGKTWEPTGKNSKYAHVDA